MSDADIHDPAAPPVGTVDVSAFLSVSFQDKRDAPVWGIEAVHAGTGLRIVHARADGPGWTIVWFELHVARQSGQLSSRRFQPWLLANDCGAFDELGIPLEAGEVHSASRARLEACLDERFPWWRSAPWRDIPPEPLLAAEPPEQSIKGERSWVYFVQYGPGGPIKIGTAQSVASRVAGFQTASPIPLELLGTMPGGPALEHELHREFRDAHQRGEWFEPTPALLARIAELTALPAESKL
jgi:hypothetical protein